jgi:hypothetical protein
MHGIPDHDNKHLTQHADEMQFCTLHVRHPRENAILRKTLICPLLMKLHDPKKSPGKTGAQSSYYKGLS